MAANYTEHYQLNQWEPEDKVLRADFNADNLKIDGALAELRGAMPVIVAGTYTGDGAASQWIPLEGEPKAVFSLRANGYLSQEYQTVYFGGLALPDHPVMAGSRTVVALEGSGFRVYENSNQDINANTANYVYHYVALM